MRLFKTVEPEALIPLPFKVVELAPFWIVKLDNTEESLMLTTRPLLFPSIMVVSRSSPIITRVLELKSIFSV